MVKILKILEEPVQSIYLNYYLKKDTVTIFSFNLFFIKFFVIFFVRFIGRNL